MSAEGEDLRDALQKANDEKNAIKIKAIEIVKRCKALEAEKVDLESQLAESKAQCAALTSAASSGVTEPTNEAELAKYKTALDKAVAKLKSQKAALDVALEEKNESLAAKSAAENALANAVHERQGAVQAAIEAVHREKDAVIATLQQNHERALQEAMSATAAAANVGIPSADEMARYKAALDKAVAKLKSQKAQLDAEHDQLQAALNIVKQKDDEIKLAQEKLESSCTMLSDTTSQISSLQAVLNSKDQEIEIMKANIDAGRHSIQELQSQISSSSEEHQATKALAADLELQCASLKEQLAESLRTAQDNQARVHPELLPVINSQASSEEFIELQKALSDKEILLTESVHAQHKAQDALLVAEEKVSELSQALEIAKQQREKEILDREVAFLAHQEQVEHALHAHKVEADKRHQELEDMKRKHHELAAEHDQHKLDHAAHLMSRKHIEEALHAAQVEVADLRLQLDKAAASLEENAREIDTYISEQQELALQLRDLEETVQSRSAEILRLTTEKNAALASLNELQDISSDAAKQLSGLQEALQESQASLLQKESELNTLHSSLAAVQASLKEKEESLAAAAERYTSLQSEHETLAASHAEVKAQAKKHITALKAQVDDLQKSYTEQQGLAASLDLANKALSEANSIEATSKESLHKLQIELVQQNELLKSTHIEALAAAEKELVKVVAEKDAANAEFETYRTKSKNILQKVSKEKLDLEESMNAKVVAVQTQLDALEQAQTKVKSDLQASQLSERALQRQMDELQSHLERASHDAQEHLNKLNEREMELMDYRERQESSSLGSEQYEYLRQAFVKLFLVNESSKNNVMEVHRLEGKHIGIARVICAILKLTDEDCQLVQHGVTVYSEALQAQTTYLSYQSGLDATLDATRSKVAQWMQSVFPSAATSSSPATSAASPAPTPAPTPLKMTSLTSSNSDLALPSLGHPRTISEVSVGIDGED